MKESQRGRMRFVTSLWALGALIVSLTLGLGAGQGAPIEQDADVYLFSFFRGNGETGLYLAWSRDGLKWTELPAPGTSFLKPEVGGKLMRDPCIVLGPDGAFHMVWTTGWNKPATVGYASSSDLVHWSEQRALPVMDHEPEARNVWAPELFYDESEKEWLIFWASTIPGRFPETEAAGDNGWNHRVYHTTTRDFETFTPTKLFYDDGFNVIDATILPARGKYHLIVKDETKTPVKKHLRIAVADRPQGPYGNAGKPFTIDWVEGPSAIRIGDLFFVYFDHYTQPRYYGAARSRDLVTWEDISTQVSFPQGIRHGSVLKAPESVVAPLMGKTDN